LRIHEIIDNLSDDLELIKPGLVRNVSRIPDIHIINFLSDFGRVKRLEPAEVLKYDREGAFIRSEEYLKEKSRGLFDLVSEVINPDGWVEDADMLLSAHLSLELTEDESREVFKGLFNDLDGAFLILALDQMMHSPQVIPESVYLEFLNCLTFLRLNPDLFLPCANFVKSQYDLIRPDIATFPDLEITLFPFRVTIEQQVELNLLIDDNMSWI
jgi:hypothetical protein